MVILWCFLGLILKQLGGSWVWTGLMNSVTGFLLRSRICVSPISVLHEFSSPCEYVGRLLWCSQDQFLLSGEGGLWIRWKVLPHLCIGHNIFKDLWIFGLLYIQIIRLVLELGNWRLAFILCEREQCSPEVKLGVRKCEFCSWIACCTWGRSLN